MAETPKKLVRWDVNDVSFQGLGSPTFEYSEGSVVSTGSLDYINAQLLAHGFITPPGLRLDGLSNMELDRTIKCVLGLLSQRIEDMARTEDLTAKFRTLSYDHDRLMAMYRTANERAANAEREMNLHKSRLSAANRSLKSAENAHKQTTAELQRTRTNLQALRSSHQSELKKKDKEVERMSEKWSRIADAQTKLTMTASGMKCANVDIIEGVDDIGHGEGFLEVALEEAENARLRLSEENGHLKKLLLRAINDAQIILHQAQSYISEEEEEPNPFTPATLFPLSPPDNAINKLTAITSRLRDCLTSLAERPLTTNQPSTSNSKEPPHPSPEEIERLKSTIANLKQELEHVQKKTTAQAAETQAIVDRFAKDGRLMTDDAGDISVDLMTAPQRDEEKERLDDMRKGIDSERQNITEAAIKLGKERLALEAERIALIEERRTWQVQQILDELPLTPQPASPVRPAVARLSPKKSPRKSPTKVPVGRVGHSTRKSARISRRLLASPSKVVPAFETEVIPPIPAPTFNIKPLSLNASLLPTSFVLPPPSPKASLPTEPALPETTQKITEPESTTPSISPPAGASHPPPTTPPAARRPFPVAKPFAHRMIHAYSPAKPSPLSRILMLADSPGSPETIPEEDLESSNELGPVPEARKADRLSFQHIPPLQPSKTRELLSLAAELGVEESSTETPLQEKKLESNIPTLPAVSTKTNNDTAKGRGLPAEPKVTVAQERTKTKVEPKIIATTRAKGPAAVEKENTRMRPNSRASSAPKISPPVESGAPKAAATKSGSKPTINASSRARPVTKVPPPGKNGPRRVPIDSTEAPAIARGWR